MQTWILASNPYIGGMKDLELDDLYTGLARGAGESAPYSARVMRGIKLATKLHKPIRRLILAQAHLDLLDAQAVARWFRREDRNG